MPFGFENCLTRRKFHYSWKFNYTLANILQSKINFGFQFQVLSANWMLLWFDTPTLRSHVVLSSRLLGFRSLCSTLAEWMYLSPRRIWYRKQQMWSLLSLCNRHTHTSQFKVTKSNHMFNKKFTFFTTDTIIKLRVKL